MRSQNSLCNQIFKKKLLETRLDPHGKAYNKIKLPRSKTSQRGTGLLFIAESWTCSKMTWCQKSLDSIYRSSSRSNQMTMGQFPDWEGTCLKGLLAKFLSMSNSLTIVTQSRHVFSRNTCNSSQISHRSCDKNSENTFKR